MDGRSAQAAGDLLRPRFQIMMWYGSANGRVVVYSAVPGTTEEQVSHRRGDTGAEVLATKIRLENGNDHRMEKKKAITAVRRKRKLLRWKQETGEIRNRCNILG